MNPFFVTDFSISDSLKTVRKSVLIYETIIVLPITVIIKEQLLYMMFLIARCIHGSENIILLEKMVCPINAGTTKRMMKSMNWSGCAGRTYD